MGRPSDEVRCHEVFETAAVRLCLARFCVSPPQAPTLRFGGRRVAHFRRASAFSFLGSLL